MSIDEVTKRALKATAVIATAAAISYCALTPKQTQDYEPIQQEIAPYHQEFTDNPWLDTSNRLHPIIAPPESLQTYKQQE